MPPERFAPDDPREWLRRADSNLAQARSRPPGVCLEDLCFQTQQTVEKALKALLLSRGVRPPFTHDIALLLRLIEQAGQAIPSEIRRAVRLTDYAVETRYPGLFEAVTDQEYEDAAGIAAQCVDWARSVLP